MSDKSNTQATGDASVLEMDAANAGDEQPPLYRDLMRFKPDGLTPNAWAVQAGVSRTVWADMRRHGNPSRRTLQRLLVAAGSSLAEFEALRVGDRPVPFAPPGDRLRDFAGRAWAAGHVPPLPLIASCLAGHWGDEASEIELTEIRPNDVLEQVARPPTLTSDGSAYALTIVGNSMWPRFRPARRVAVSPKSPIAIGDDVLVQLRTRSEEGGALALIKELVRRTGSAIELRQFTPDVTFMVDPAEVAAMHRIAGELI